MNISLSTGYTPGTTYFHCFPAGEDSGFFNPVPPWVDELSPGRALVCAGKGVKVMVFGSATTPSVYSLLRDELGVPLVSEEQLVRLPASINANIDLGERNTLIKEALRDLVEPGTFVMSQPYLDPKIESLYCIPSERIVHLNDKSNLSEYMPLGFIPACLFTFANGEVFFAATQLFPLPCVVKVASSSGGDGVYVCRSADDMEEAQKKFRHISKSIYIEEYVDIAQNLCVQFILPPDLKAEAKIVGINEQMTSKEGGFLGGRVDSRTVGPEVQEVFKIMIERIFPRLREKGWYGVGGIDVLLSKDKKIYFIDGNFRMNASFPFVCLAVNEQITKPLINFTASFKGTRADFLNRIKPIAQHGSPDQILAIINMGEKENLYRFHAAVLFENEKQLKENVQRLLKLGVEAAALNALADGSN